MAKWNPFWTDEVKIENGGRYPLLFNRFHDHMEDYLIKGIVSNTDRLRYISYCCWAIGDIEHTMKCSKYIEFEEAFRRRESALAVGTYLLQPKTLVGNYSIYGTDTIKTKGFSEDKVCDCSFRVLPSKALGAFGQYYKGTLQNWGLTYVDEQGMIRLTELGNELYEIMVKGYSTCEYYNLYKGKQHVTGKVLKSWAETNKYDNITDAHHVSERSFYRKVLFHLDTKEATDYRRDSLTIYLECIKECNKLGINFDEDILRNVFYYKRIMIKDEIKQIELSTYLQDAAFYWLMYEIQVYFRWWISEYFRFFLKGLVGNSGGVTLDEIISSINEETFNKKTKDIIKYDGNCFSLTFEKLISHVNDVNTPDKCFLEDKLRYTEVKDISHLSAYLIITLALLYGRYTDIKNDTRYCTVRMKLIDDYWFEEFFTDIDSVKDYTIPQLLRFLLYRYAIQKHDNAMYLKNDLRRCWFTKSGERYQHESDSTSIWRPAKHNIISNFLFDMNLITIKGGYNEMTDEGEKFYKELKEKIYNNG